MEKLFCPIIGCPHHDQKPFNRKDNFDRHMNMHNKAHLKKCPFCKYEGRIDSVKRHFKLKHEVILALFTMKPFAMLANHFSTVSVYRAGIQRDQVTHWL